MTVSSTETALLRHVLAWDFEKMTASTKNERKARKHSDGQEDNDQRCLSAEEYSQWFSPLLLEEARAQLVQVREGLPSSSQASGSQMTDEANQLCSHLALARQVEDNGGGFRMVKVAVDGESTKAYKEGDLIQCVPACPEGSTTQPDSDARALALVTRREGQSSLWLKLYIGLFRPVRGDRDARRHHDAVLARLQEGPSAWTIRRVWSLSTTAREWHAIHAVRTLPFCPILLDPQRQLGPPRMKQPFRAPRPLANQLKSILNSDQLDFLQRSLEFSGVLLLQGPPGTGKTLFAQALASMLGRPFVKLDQSRLSDWRVDSMPQKVGRLFEEAEVLNGVIFIDEVDQLIAQRGDDQGTNKQQKVTNAFLTRISESDEPDFIFVGTTNRIDLIDDAMLRPGRFGKQIEVDKPDVDARLAILQTKVRDYTDGERLEGLEDLAEQTEGWTGDELDTLVRRARKNAADERADSLRLDHFPDDPQQIVE